MFRLLRNTHLALGLMVSVMAFILAVSSLFVIYRPWLPDKVTETEQTIRVAGQAARTPRALARELMRAHGLRGELLGITDSDESFAFRIFRPGTEHHVEYSRIASEARVLTRQWQLGQTLLQIHVTTGFWHEFVPANLWAALSLLASVGLLLLGLSGIYLWFAQHDERLTGGILLAVGLSYGLVTLVLTRLDS